MTKKGGRNVHADELALWRAAMKSARPLGKRIGAEADAEPEERAPAAPRSRSAPPKPQAVTIKAPAMRAITSIEVKLLRAIRRGTVPIEARLDLHGLTQVSAHERVERFLIHAQARGHRVVLVVTGKGTREAEQAVTGERSERGVLRKLLPRWLALAPMRESIVGLSPAAPRHGGEGALYIQLRRRREH
jgi:DNA-nicking Smr family endonuclease